MKSYQEILQNLKKSTFRSRFKLKDKDFEYIGQKGLDIIKSHAYDFITKRLAPCEIANDGKQTPMRGHPVFIAQHATATCCRGCLEKWHHISQHKKLSDYEIYFVVNLIMAWIEEQIKNKN